MDPSAKGLELAFVEGLRRGGADPELLARAGEPDPERGVRAFAAAMQDAELAARCELWGPELLLGARPAFGAEGLLELWRARGARGLPPLDPSALPHLARVLASSNFLARLLGRRGELADELRGTLPGRLCRSDVMGQSWSALRASKYRGLLRVAARDLASRPFEQSLGELSELTEVIVEMSVMLSAREVDVSPPAVLALGKLGGQEINFSSDVDLLVIYEASDPPDFQRGEEVARFTRRLKQRLEEPTVDGFLYRMDLDLRPRGKDGPLASSLSAALEYYEAFGAEWERQMLIRLRPLAGAAEVAAAFARDITPFVYRRTLDPDAVTRVGAMKRRIEEERQAERRDLDRDLKEGPGGIRDVEFFVQALQLFHGGARPELRTGNVLLALVQLERGGLLPAATGKSLTDAYLWLRRAEHALQMAEERSVHTVPPGPGPERELARRMGYRDPEGEHARERFLEDWLSVRTEVRGHFDSLVLRAAS